MRRKKSLLIPAVLAFSLCTGAVVPVLAEETSQTADAADNEQEAHIHKVLRILLIPLMKKAPSQTLIFRVNG